MDEPSKLEQAFVALVDRTDPRSLRRRRTFVTVTALWAVAMCGQAYNQLTLLQGAVERHRRNRAI